MANLQKFTVQEALNAQGVGGLWATNSVVSVPVSSGTTTNVDVSDASQLGVYAEGEMQFSFSNTNGTSISDRNDLVLPADMFTFITVPRGLGDTIYFNCLGTSSTTLTTLRLVEV